MTQNLRSPEAILLLKGEANLLTRKMKHLSIEAIFMFYHLNNVSY